LRTSTFDEGDVDMFKSLEILMNEHRLIE